MAAEPESPEATHQANPPSTTPLAIEKIPQTQEKNVNGTQEAQNEEPPKPPMLGGWRLGVLTAGLCLCVFLSALDITIVSTSLAAISNDLDAFEESSWIVSSYLTTYFSFLIIWARLSDLIGRKLMLMTAIVLFLAFSAACGGGQTALQIIICRAFQGIGGAGIFSMVPIITAEMVEPEKYGAYNGIISSFVALSFLLGPIFGGAISNGTTWRWVFLINLPIGAIALVLIFVAMPSGFPDPSAQRTITLRNRVDYPGFLVLLAACALLILAIEEAGTKYAWSSALVITCLVIAGVLFILFITWQWYINNSRSRRDPVFPWSFTKNRVLMGAYLNALLSGVSYVTLVLELPLRFMTINGKSGLEAGIYILPFTLGMGFASAMSGVFTAKGRVPLLVVLSAATALQLLGAGLLYSVPVTTALPARIYGYQLLAGLGTGLSLTTILTSVPSMVGREVLAVGMGGVTQLRILGGALGTSVATTLLNTTVKNKLATKLSASTLAAILKDVSSVKTLSNADQVLVRDALGAGYHKQLAMILGFCAAEVIALAIMWEWPLRRLK